MAVPLLALKLGYDKAAVGLLIALFALPQILLALPAGRWADRRGLKVPVRSSVMLAVLGGAVAAAWPLYPVLCVTALFTGASIATAAIAIQRHAGRMAGTPEEFKHAFSWLSMAPALSNFVGPLTAGLTIDHAGYPAAFVLLAALSIAGWWWIRSARDMPHACSDKTKSATAWSLWHEPWFGRVLLLNCFTAGSFEVHAFAVPVLGHERGLSASAIGSILGSFAIATAAVRSAIPFIATRLQEWMFITVAMAITALSFLIYPFAQSPLAMALCSAAIGMATGGVQPMVMSLLLQITAPHRHGEVVAMRHLMINVTSVAMPMLLGAVSGLAGVSGLLWLMSIVVGAGSRLGFALRNIDKGRDH